MQKSKVSIEFHESYTVMYSQKEGVNISVRGECEMEYHYGTNKSPDDMEETTFTFSKVFYCVDEVSTHTLKTVYAKLGQELTQQDIDSENTWIAVDDFEEEYKYSSDKPHLKGFIEQVKEYCLEAAANYEDDEN